MAALSSHKRGGNRAAQTCRTHHRYPKTLEEGLAICVLSCPGFITLCSVDLNMHSWSSSVLPRQGSVLRMREASSKKHDLPV